MTCNITKHLILVMYGNFVTAVSPISLLKALKTKLSLIKLTWIHWFKLAAKEDKEGFVHKRRLKKVSAWRSPIAPNPLVFVNCHYTALVNMELKSIHDCYMTFNVHFHQITFEFRSISSVLSRESQWKTIKPKYRIYIIENPPGKKSQRQH